MLFQINKEMDNRGQNRTGRGALMPELSRIEFVVKERSKKLDFSSDSSERIRRRKENFQKLP